MISKVNILDLVEFARRVIHTHQWLEKHQYAVVCVVDEI